LMTKAPKSIAPQAAAVAALRLTVDNKAVSDMHTLILSSMTISKGVKLYIIYNYTDTNHILSV